MPRIARLGLRALVLASAALLVWGATATQAAGRAVPRGFYGVIWAGEITGAAPDVRARAWDALASGGAESVRAVFNWEFAQPSQDGPFQWDATDEVVGAAAAHGMSVMPTIEHAPDWARQYPGLAQSPPTDGVGFAGFAHFAGELVRRYGPKGTFWSDHPELPRRPVGYWQIWNEPEITDHWWRTGHWAPREDRRYGNLLRASYQAIHEADPGAKVVLSGLTNYAWNDLATLYRDAGIRGHFDVAAVHMFPGDWRNVAVIVRRFRHVLDSHGGRHVPIWSTEVAWPAAKNRGDIPSWANTPYYRNFVTTDRGMASRLANAYALLSGRSFRAANRLERVFWFLATSSYQGSYMWDYSGLLQFDGSSLVQKPAYRAYRAAARRGEGCSKNAAGRCR